MGHRLTARARLADGSRLGLLQARNVLVTRGPDSRIKAYRALYPLFSHLAHALRVPFHFE
jgi:hypothetical protein